MKKILLTSCHHYYNPGCEFNKGGTAVVISTIKMLKSRIPDAELSTFIQLPEEFGLKYDLKIFHNKMYKSKCYSVRTISISTIDFMNAFFWRLLNKRFSSFSKLFIRGRLLKEYAQCDVIVDISMDHYSDDFGLITVLEQSKDMLIGVLLNKPVIIWAQSIGPFCSKISSWLAKTTLKRVSMIILREDISAKYLKDLGICSPKVYITADPAFTLEPVSKESAFAILSKENINIESRPIIGIAMGWTSLMRDTKRSKRLKFLEFVFKAIRLMFPENVIEFMKRSFERINRANISKIISVTEITKIIDNLIDTNNAYIILISHSTDPVLDDRLIAENIISAVKRPERVSMLKGDYSAPELKGVIGLCDLFIGAKMHANIAALSMNIPTVGLQYSHKFYGIMKSLGQSEYVCENIKMDEVLLKVNKAWENRDIIKYELLKRMNLTIKQSLENAELVATFISNKY